MTAKGSGKTAWSIPVRRDDVPDTGLHLDLAADAASRAAVATLAGVREIARLEASFDVTRQGSGLRVAGEVRASVGQTCVVTLEPIASEINEPVDLVFRPPGATVHASDAAHDLDPAAEDEPELLVDGTADLGAAATEFLLLAIDPYPRKPGVIFEAPASGDAGAHPFAALEALKKKPGSG